MSKTLAMASQNKPVNGATMPVRKYGAVRITLENVLIPPEKYKNSPSSQDGLDPEIEMDLRVLGCELIQTSGILLKLPQVAMATGQVLFQRFYYAKSLVRYPMETTAMACVALASKIEESPMKIRDVINVFNHIKQVKNEKTIQPTILDSNYIALKNQVVKAERRLLKELGFCCHVKHPHKIIIMYLRLLEAEQKKLAQSSWNFMNDALRSDVFVRFSPETIACACIWLAGRSLKIPLPENPPWYHIFRVPLNDIEYIAAAILKLYTRKKVKLEVLEARVEAIRREQQEARLRNKAVIAMATPKEVNTFSPASRHTTPPKVHDQKRRSSSEREKRSVSSDRSRSRSPARHARRKRLRRTPSRSPSPRDDRRRDRRKRSSRSPTITPPPRFIKHKEKGQMLRSLSRSASRSPLRMKSDKSRNDKYESRRLISKYDDASSRKKKKHSKDSHRHHKKYGVSNGYDKHKLKKVRTKSRERENRRR